MSLLTKLESKLESAVEGIFTRAFRGRVQPLEIARKIERAMDDKKVLSIETAYAPNRFVVRLHPADHGHLSPFAATIVPELERYVAEYAQEIGCKLSDEPAVELVADESVKSGTLQVSAEISDTPSAIQRKVRKRSRGTRFLLEVLHGGNEGETFEVTEAETILGRSSDCTIPLADPSASRHHARVVVSDGLVTLEDMGSTNGTFVNDHRIETTELQPQDVVDIGETTLKFKVVHAV